MKPSARKAIGNIAGEGLQIGFRGFAESSPIFRAKIRSPK
jgi:hypothetical protein